MALNATALVDLNQAKQFLRIDAASSLHIDAEYVGVGTGALKTFDLDFTPVDGSLRLFVNGVLQVNPTTFSISGVHLTFVANVPNGHPITASYDTAASSNTFEAFDDALLESMINAATERAEAYTGRAFVIRTITESHEGEGTDTIRLYRRPVNSITSVSYRRVLHFTGDGSVTIFGLGYTPVAGSLTVYVNGVLKATSADYSLSGMTVTFTSAPADDSDVLFRFTVAMIVASNYTEKLHIGRIQGSWLAGYEYIITYSAGYAATRTLTQDALPNAMLAVLLIISDLYENRGDKVGSMSIGSLGSVSYNLPSRAAELLSEFRIDIC